MTTDTRFITAEELLEMPSDRMCELVRGEIVDMSPPGQGHGLIGNNFSWLITTFVKAGKLGRVYGSETGFKLAKNPDTVRAPDVAFVRSNRLPQDPFARSYFEGSPDLAIEVLSPSDRAEAVEEKVDEYLGAGAIEVLVVSPKRRTVTVYKSNANPVVIGESDRLTGLETLPGFECEVAAIFE